jgi:hypothetical protein
MPYTTTALVDQVSQVRTIVDELHAAGFPTDAISVVFPDRHRQELMGLAPELVREVHRQSGQGAVVGATTGGVLGTAMAWLAGVGVLTLPGVGPLLAVGPILAVLSGIGIGASLGGLAGALIGWGMPELDARRFESHISDGRILIAARCGEPRLAVVAQEIMRSAGGQEIRQVRRPQAPNAAGTGQPSG